MENTKATIEERVKFIIAQELVSDLSDVKNESILTSDLGADSLDTVGVVMELEKEFKIMIQDDIAEELSTVQDHIDIVQKLYVEDLEVDLSNENTEGRV